VSWLNSLPDVQAGVGPRNSRAEAISEQNLSEWKAGGYRDWLLQQEAIELVRHMERRFPASLNQVSQVRLTDLLAQTVGRALRGRGSGVEPAERVGPRRGRDRFGKTVARVSAATSSRCAKGDHSAERLKLEPRTAGVANAETTSAKLREEEFQRRGPRDTPATKSAGDSRLLAEKIGLLRKIMFGDVD